MLLLLLRLDHEYTTIVDFCRHLREIIDVFPDLTKSLMLAFSLTLFYFRQLCTIITLLRVCRFP